MAECAVCAARAAELARSIGRYRFYVYEGPAVDNMTRLLQLPPITPRYANVPWTDAEKLRRNIFPEYTAAVWIHRALLRDPSRTLDPEEAELFFVPAYLEISAIQPDHTERLRAWLAFINGSAHYKRHGGADHLFGTSDVREDERMQYHGHALVRSLLGRGFTGVFEIRPGWAGGWAVENAIVMPYVADPFLTSASERRRTRQASARVTRDLSLFYVAHVRSQA